MPNPDLLNYIRDAIGKGFPKDQIRDALLSSGWRMDDISEAFALINQGENAVIEENVPLISKKKILAASISVGGFLITAGAVLAGFFYYKTLPARAIAALKGNLVNVKSAKFDFKVKISGLEENFGWEVNSKGGFDVLDEASPKQYAIADFNIRFPKQKSASEFLLNIGDLKGKIEHRLIGKNFYFKPEAGDVKFFGFNLDELLNQLGMKDKWIKSDLGKLESDQILNSYIPDEDFPVQENPAQKKDIGEKIKELAEKYEFLDADYIGSEVIGGIKIKKIRFDLDKGKLKEFLLKASEQSEQAIPMVSDYEDNRKEEIEKSVNSIESAKGSFWIGQDNFLYKATFDLAMDDEEVGKMDMNLEFQFSDYNKPIELEEPENWIAVEEAIEKITEYFFGKTQM
ncbi:MAG: hypothetical protein V1698_03350 [bacterium]